MDLPIDNLVFGDFMAYEILTAQEPCDWIVSRCRKDDHIGSIVAKFAYEIGRLRPIQAVVFAGIQDAIMGMEPEEYQFHISALIQSAKSLTVPLTIVKPLPCGDRSVEKRLSVFRRKLEVLDRQRKIYLLDVYELVSDRFWEGEMIPFKQFKLTYYEDAIHLNMGGKKIMAEALTQYLLNDYV